MKKTLVKISMIAALALSMQLGSIKHVLIPISSRDVYFVCPQEQELSKQEKRYIRLFACNTDASLMTYHIGLNALFPHYNLPRVVHLIHTIRSHQTYCGILSKKQGKSLFKQKRAPFLIFEERGSENTPHFYIAYEKGLRHFKVVNGLQREELTISSLENGIGPHYPTLENFICCTLS